MDARPAAPWGRRLARAIVGLIGLLVLVIGAVAWYFSGLVAAPAWVAQKRGEHAAELAEFVRESGALPFDVRTADGLTLRGVHLPAHPGNDRFVVMVHGYLNNLLDFRRQYQDWRALGFDVFLFSHRFCGASDGAWTTCGVEETRDLGAVVAEARRRLGPQARGGILGRSMGAAVVLMYAAEHPDVAFVVAECPFSSFEAELRYRLDQDYGFVPRGLRAPILATTRALVRLRYGFDVRDSAPERDIERVRAPVLYLVTAEDRYVPPEMTRALYARTRAPKQLREFPHGGHAQAWNLYPAEYDAEVRAFLAAHAPDLRR